MKTAQEWEECRKRESLLYWQQVGSNSKDFSYMDIKFIQSIQLDAFQAGLHKAASIVLPGLQTLISQ